MAVTYYVNPNSTAGGDGTTSAITGPNRAYVSGGAAISARSGEADDITLLFAGSGPVDSSQKFINGTSATSWLLLGDVGQTDGRYTGNEDWSTSHYISEVTGAVDGFEIYDSDVTIRGLQISQAGTSNKNAIRLGPGTVLEGCRIRSSEAERIVYVPPSLGTSGIKIHSNIIKHLANDNGSWYRSIVDEAWNNTYVDCATAARGTNFGVSTYNIAFINCTTDADSTPSAEGNNGTSNATLTNLPTDNQVSMVQGTDWNTATDFRAVSGGKMDGNGNATNKAAQDVNGNTFANDNIGSFNEVAGGTPTDDLLADDIESASQLSQPAIGQTHVLAANDLQSASEVQQGVLGQTHGLAADDLESASQLSRPNLATGADHNLLADDLQSASEIQQGVLGQTHVLAANDLQSASELSRPALGQIVDLFANDLESASQLSRPTLTEAAAALLADDLESASELQQGVLGQVHVLTANDLESASQLNRPALDRKENQFTTFVDLDAVYGPVNIDLDAFYSSTEGTHVAAHQDFDLYNRSNAVLRFTVRNPDGSPKVLTGTTAKFYMQPRPETAHALEPIFKTYPGGGIEYVDEGAGRLNVVLEKDKIQTLRDILTRWDYTLTVEEGVDSQPSTVGAVTVLRAVMRAA